MKTRLTLALSAAFVLAACDRTPAPQPDAESYNDSESETEAEPASEPEAVQIPADEPAPPPATVAVEPLPPADPVPVDDQMREDAEATGMTARVARDGGEATENAPVAEVRE